MCLYFNVIIKKIDSLPIAVICVIFFVLNSFHHFGQEFDFLSTQIQKIDNLAKKNDTTSLTKTFYETKSWIENNNLPEEDKAVLKYNMLETQQLVKFSKIRVDSGITRYLKILSIANTPDYFTIQTVCLGRIANAYRSMGLMGEAFEFNQKEIDAAKKSKDSLLIGRALITELDIAYNSLPWPIQHEDLNDLIHHGEEVIAHANKYNLGYILAFGKLYVSKFYIKQEDFVKADSILATISNTEPLSATFSKYEHLCEIAKKTGNTSKYREYTLEFKKRAYQTRRSFVLLNAHNFLLDYSLKVNNSDSAKYYAELLEKNLTQVDTTKYLDFLDITYNTLARYYQDHDVNKERQYLSYSVQVNKAMAARQKLAFMAIRKYQDKVSNLEETNTGLSDSIQFFKNNIKSLILLSIVLLFVVFLLYRKYYSTRTKMVEVSEEKEKIEEKVIKKSIELNNKTRVYLEELKFIKSDKNYVEFHTLDKRIVDRNKLSKVLEELPPNFIQVHRSYVVNRNFIKTIDSTRIVLLPQIEIPLSRLYKNRLKEIL